MVKSRNKKKILISSSDLQLNCSAIKCDNSSPMLKRQKSPRTASKTINSLITPRSPRSLLTSRTPRNPVISRKRTGSYTGDPMEPNLSIVHTDPVHKRRKIKSLKHRIAPLKASQSFPNPENPDFDFIFQDSFSSIEPLTSYYNPDAPDIRGKDLQWVHLSCKGNPPTERSYHASSIVGKYLYITFGTDGETIMNQIYRLDLSSYTWNKLIIKGKIPPHRYGHTCTVIDNQLLIFGGRNKEFVLSDMYLYNILNNSWKKIKPKDILPARAYHQTYIHKEYLYIIGGIDYSGKTSDKIIQFNLVSYSWKYIQIPGFKGRARFSLLQLDYGKIGIIGGCVSNKGLFSTAGKYAKDMLIIDIPYLTIIRQQKLEKNFRLVNLTAIAYDSNIIMFGGYNRNKRNITSDLKILSNNDHIWESHIYPVKSKGFTPPDLEGHSLNVHRNGFIIFGGQASQTGLSNQCYLLQKGGLLASQTTSIDLFDALIAPIRQKFKKQASLLTEYSIKDISNETIIAKGASGIIKRVLLNNHYVVLKQFFNQDYETFKAEINILAGLQHPNIVKCIGVIRKPKNSVILEYIPLGDLFNFIQKQQSSFSWEYIIAIAKGIAKAMEFLHSHNILHRDLKSLNILVTSTNPNDKVCVKLADFGDSKESFRYDNSNELCGTMRWTAPEIFRGEIFTCKSDVFSYSIILWELYTQKLPYETHIHDFEVEQYILSGNRLEIPDNCILGYKTLIESCWHENPQLRPTFEQILAILSDLSKQLVMKQRAFTQ